MKYIIILFSCFFVSCIHDRLDKETIANHLKDIGSDSTYSYLPAAGFIADEDAAVEVAEPILFKIYGEDHVKDQKPYQVHLIDSVWVINGTLPMYITSGGTFFIVLNKKDGKVLHISHGK